MLQPEFEPEPSSKNIQENQIYQQQDEIKPGKFNDFVGKPRTANKAFGGILDFLLFFENRNPEIKEFVQDLKQIEKMEPDLSIKELNTKIVPKIDQCLTEMHKKVGTKLKNRYVGLFSSPFKTWEEFYNQVFGAYTIAGFLYEYMNEFLRNEDWEKLDDILPYTYALFKAFLWGNTTQTQTFSKNFELLKSKSNENKLILYRGADFDDVSLKFYDTSKTKYFSWNGVTSTSLSKDIAKKFQNNLSAKTPVLITIEVDFENLNPQDLNILYLEDVTKHPGEQEVAFPPGSIFELLDQSEKAEVVIRLKLVTNAKDLAQKGQFMHGMLQSVMGRGTELKIICLKEKELSRAIKHCKRNRLITKFEFSLCNLNKWSAEILLNVLPTMKSLQSFIFNSVVLEKDCCLDQMMKCLGQTKITKLEIANSLQDGDDLKSFIKCFEFFSSLEILKLSFQEEKIISRNLITDLCNEGKKYLDQKCLFELNLQNGKEMTMKCLTIKNSQKIFKDELELTEVFLPFPVERNTLNLVGRKNRIGYSLEKDSRIQKSTFKEALIERFPSNLSNEEKWEMLENPLEELTIILEASDDAFNEDFKNIDCEGLQDLQRIRILNLHIGRRLRLADEMLQILKSNIILQFKGLEMLHLNFDEHQGMTNGGAKILSDLGIQHLQGLTALNLSFGNCRITDKDLSDLGVWLAKMPFLTSLNLDFNSCFEITDQGLQSLFSDNGGIQNLNLLVNLSLNFNSCFITDKGIEILNVSGLQILQNSLKILNLNFQMSDKSKGRNYPCSPITNRGLMNFYFPKNLTTLSLSFHNYSEIDNSGLECLTKTISSLRSLEELHLSFDSCKRIIDSGLEVLCSQGIQLLQNLNSLHLRFGNTKEVLSSEKKALSLFQRCETITDKSLESIAFNGIRHLPELKTLHLDFDGYDKITSGGLESLCTGGIQHLKKLTVLHLNFSNCEAINNKGLHLLCQKGLLSLKDSLNQLELDFSGCCELSDAGLDDIWSTGISTLPFLSTLRLNFFNCWKMTRDQLLFLQDQISLLNLPQFQLLFENPSQESSKVFLLKNPNAASVFCQDRIEFSYQDQNQQYLLQEFKFQQNQIAENVTLKFEGHDGGFFGLTDLDLFRSIFSSNFMMSFKNLKTLQLNFNRSVITDHMLHGLCSECLQHLGSLNSLYLSFERCIKITSQGLKILGSSGIKHLNLLANLYLNFNECFLKADQVLEILKDIQHPELMKTLGLKLIMDGEIREERLMNFYCSKIQHLKFLTVLSLEFHFKTTDETIKELFDHGIQHLESSKSTHLILRLKDQDERKSLTFQGVKSPKSSFIYLYSQQKVSEILKGQILQSSSSIALLQSSSYISRRRKNGSDQVDLSQSKLRRQNIGIQKNLDIIKPVNKGSVEIFTNQILTRYLGTHHYASKIHARDDYYQDLFDPNINLDYLFDIIKKDIFALILLSDFTKLRKKTIDYIHEFPADELRYLQTLTSLNLTIGESKVSKSDSPLNLLCFKVFPHLESLTTLHLNFGGCTKNKSSFLKLLININDAEIKNLSLKGMESLKFLTTLHLHFEQCHEITDVGLESLLTDGIQNLEFLTIFDLSFKHCPQITNAGFQNSKCPQSLTQFYLNLECCKDFTDKGVKSLCIEIIQHLKKLTVLHLGFRNCDGVTDDVFEYLSQGINSLQIKTLSLDFHQNWSITGKEIQNMCLPNAQSLKTLHLNFDQCPKLTNEALKNLPIKNLMSLEILNICFDKCRQITDEGIKALCENGIQSLKVLKTLSLSFAWCYYLTEKGLENLENCGIKYLNKLENLHLCFIACQQISMTRLSSFQNQIQSFSLPHLPCPLTVNDYKTIFSELNSHNRRFLDDRNEIVHEKIADGKPFELHTHLSADNLISKNCYCSPSEMDNVQEVETLFLSFDHFQGSKNPKLYSFCYEILPHLKWLKNLQISFDKCEEIEWFHDNLEALSQRIGCLEELTQLRLSFNGCQHITDTGLANLSLKGIQNLKQVKTLHLSFNGCKRITDKGVTSLCIGGILNLEVLNALYLSFDRCENITDEALKSISLKGISNLSSIENLEFSFLDCLQISNSSYLAFLKILSYFGFSEI